MKIFRSKTAINRAATIDNNKAESIHAERNERAMLLERIKTMDMEIDNIGRRRKNT